MDVVGADELDVVFAGQGDELRLDGLLYLVALVVGAHGGGLVALQLDVVVVAHQLLPPAHAAVGLVVVAGGQQLGYFAAETGRGDDQALLVGGDGLPVGTGVHVEALGPGLRHQLDKVFVARLVLGQHDKVTADVVPVDMLVQILFGDIHLAAEDGLEGLLSLGQLAVLFVDGIEKLLDTVHVAVVGDGQAGHAVGYCFVDQGINRGLAVEQRVLRVYVQMYKRLHIVTVSVLIGGGYVRDALRGVATTRTKISKTPQTDKGVSGVLACAGDMKPVLKSAADAVGKPSICSLSYAKKKVRLFALSLRRGLPSRGRTAR